jgi:hypothetical protein
MSQAHVFTLTSSHAQLPNPPTQGVAVTAASGFGLAPVSRPAQLAPLPSSSAVPAPAPSAPSAAAPPASTDAKYLEFMATMGDLGAFE